LDLSEVLLACGLSEGSPKWWLVHVLAPIAEIRKVHGTRVRGVGRGGAQEGLGCQ
jgi:hypothetical protein